MVALRVVVEPAVEPHYCEQILRSAIASAHGASLSSALDFVSCDRGDDATVAVATVDAADLVDVWGALVLGGGDAEVSVRVEARADTVAGLPPRAAEEMVEIAPSTQLLVDLW
jgi:hypothetical protein